MAYATHFMLMPGSTLLLSDEQRLVLRGIRLWVLLARTCRNARPPLQALLGNATAPLYQLMDSALLCWPENFTSFPPCAARMTPDETALLRLISHAEAEDRDAADQLLRDMLPQSDRDRLWNAATRLVAERTGA